MSNEQQTTIGTLKQQIPNDWKLVLESEFEKPYFKQLNSLILNAYANEVIYPPKKQIFRALELTPFKNCKVVIIGQDPYHGEGQANGLAFSVCGATKLPPSLKNILKEVENSTNFVKTDGDLTNWAKQGVLLINSVLTVKAKRPQSHSKIGWELLTNKIIEMLNKKQFPTAFMLWGNSAKLKENLIDNPIHLTLKSSHPSPLSAHKGFLGCNHFSKVNKFLMETNQTPINWSL